MMETMNIAQVETPPRSKKCGTCGKEKPLFAFYKRSDGTNRYYSSCIRCSGFHNEIAKQVANGDFSGLVDEAKVLLRHHYYLVTFYDHRFNQYVGLVSVRNAHKITGSLYDTGGFTHDGESVFHMMEVSEMSEVEVRMLQDNYSRTGICVPLLIIKNKSTKAQIREGLVELARVCYGTWNDK